MNLGYRRTKRKRNAPQWAPNEWVDASMTLLRRCGGRCWWCMKELNGRAARHHRQRRRDGGDRLANLILLHPGCHNLHPASVHQHPDDARERGFIVPVWADPLTYPIYAKNTWWLLDDDGGMTPTDPPS